MCGAHRTVLVIEDQARKQARILGRRSERFSVSAVRKTVLSSFSHTVVDDRIMLSIMELIAVKDLADSQGVF